MAPYDNEKAELWNYIENMVNNINKPWVMIRDLNEILSTDEKLGGHQIGSSSINFLKNFMNITGAIDLGFTGNIYTWKNNRSGLARIRQRLDRALSNDD